jgi:hypothetical protein
MLHSILSSWPLVERKSEPQRESLFSRSSSSRSIERPDHLGATGVDDDPWDDPNSTAFDRDEGTDSTMAVSLEDQLTALLRRTDQLRSLYPRSLPELGFQEVFGVLSIFNTWSQDPAHLLSDAQAEETVLNLDLMVSRYAPFPEEDIPRGPSSQLTRKSRNMRRPLGPGMSVTASALFVLGVAVVLYNGRMQNSSQLGFLWAKLDVRRSGSWLRRLYR